MVAGDDVLEVLGFCGEFEIFENVEILSFWNFKEIFDWVWI